MQGEFGLWPQQLVQVGVERSSACSDVVRQRPLVCDPSAVRELDVDVTDRINLRAEVASKTLSASMNVGLSGSALYVWARSSNPETSRSAVFLLIGFPKLAIARALPWMVVSHQTSPSLSTRTFSMYPAASSPARLPQVQIWRLRAGLLRPQPPSPGPRIFGQSREPTRQASRRWHRFLQPSCQKPKQQRAGSFDRCSPLKGTLCLDPSSSKQNV